MDPLKHLDQYIMPTIHSEDSLWKKIHTIGEKIEAKVKRLGLAISRMREGGVKEAAKGVTNGKLITQFKNAVEELSQREKRFCNKQPSTTFDELNSKELINIQHSIDEAKSVLAKMKLRIQTKDEVYNDLKAIDDMLKTMTRNVARSLIPVPLKVDTDPFRTKYETIAGEPIVASEVGQLLLTIGKDLFSVQVAFKEMKQEMSFARTGEETEKAYKKVFGRINLLYEAVLRVSESIKEVDQDEKQSLNKQYIALLNDVMRQHIVIQEFKNTIESMKNGIVQPGSLLEEEVIPGNQESQPSLEKEVRVDFNTLEDDLPGLMPGLTGSVVIDTFIPTEEPIENTVLPSRVNISTKPIAGITESQSQSVEPIIKNSEIKVLEPSTSAQSNPLKSSLADFKAKYTELEKKSLEDLKRDKIWETIESDYNDLENEFGRIFSDSEQAKTLDAINNLAKQYDEALTKNDILESALASYLQKNGNTRSNEIIKLERSIAKQPMRQKDKFKDHFAMCRAKLSQSS